LRDFADEEYGNILHVAKAYPMMELDDVELKGRFFHYSSV